MLKLLARRRKSLIYIVPGMGENTLPFYQDIVQKAKQKNCDILLLPLFQRQFLIDVALRKLIGKHQKMKKKYTKFYFIGFSIGALLGLIVSSKINFKGQMLLSTALFAENRKADSKFLRAWKRLNTLPDERALKKGILKPARQNLPYSFVTSLQKYRLNTICKNVKSPTILVIGKQEGPLLVQQKQIYRRLHAQKRMIVIPKVDHDLNTPLYRKIVLQEIENLLFKKPLPQPL